MIKVIQKEISASDFNTLTDSVGWGTREASVVEEALENTFYSVCAYDDEKLIGYGRLIGDKAVFLYVQDIMVIPQYQGKKVGSEILSALLKKVSEQKTKSPSLRTYLGASKGKEGFYKKFGFVTRSEADLGEGMVFF